MSRKFEPQGRGLALLLSPAPPAFVLAIHAALKLANFNLALIDDSFMRRLFLGSANGVIHALNLRRGAFGFKLGNSRLILPCLFIGE